MRRDEKTELLRGFLAINALLREELRKARAALEAKHNPNWRLQPRAPRGSADGGQWTKVAGGGSKQSGGAQPRPAPRPTPLETSPPRSQAGSAERPYRLPIQNLNGQEAANDADVVSIPLRVTRLSPLTWPLFLYGDTPRPTVEIRELDDRLVVAISEVNGVRRPSFFRVVEPERQVPYIVLGVDTGLTTTRPAEIEPLYVFVTLEGNNLRFSRRNLEIAYGEDIPGISVPGEDVTSNLPSIVPLTTEERLLDFRLRGEGVPDELLELALQSLRIRESEGEYFVRALQQAGADRRTIESILRELRTARRYKPYRPPTSGPLVDIFPGLTTAQGHTMVYPAEGWEDGPALQASRSARAARTMANSIIEEIRAVDPNYVTPNLNDPSIFPETQAGRLAYLERLQQERAATLFRVRGDLQPLQVETFRFLQRRADIAYDEAARLYDNGEISSPRNQREHAIGTEVDRILDTELKEFYESLGLAEGELLRVHRAEYITLSTHRIPDARVGDIFFDVSVREKRPNDDQVIDFFAADARPRYVIIVRPRQRGRSYIITPPPSRYAKERKSCPTNHGPPQRLVMSTISWASSS